MKGSRDRGCNGHRILRRVPVDGRHLGSPRNAVFHETARTAVSAVSRILRPVLPQGRTVIVQHPRRRVRRRVNEASRQRCQRLDLPSAPWEQYAHARLPTARKEHEARVEGSVRRSGRGRRETSSPPEASRGARDSTRPSPAAKVARASRETREVRVHVVRMGGRSRSSASRIAVLGKTARLLGGSGDASRAEVRSPSDVGRGRVEGETVRPAHGLEILVSMCRASGVFGPSGSRYDRRRSQTLARLVFTDGTSRKPSGSQGVPLSS